MGALSERGSALKNASLSLAAILLVATLFRLGLNVASTRLVLSEAHAGEVIQAFGEITISGSLLLSTITFTGRPSRRLIIEPSIDLFLY